VLRGEPLSSTRLGGPYVSTPARFQPGNVAAVKHGAHSDRSITPLARELEIQLLGLELTDIVDTAGLP
jgi:hypothetical protein